MIAETGIYMQGTQYQKIAFLLTISNSTCTTMFNINHSTFTRVLSPTETATALDVADT